MKPLKEYSLWLEPSGDEFKKINKVLSKLQKETKSVGFKPHVTLLGGLYYKEDSLIEMLSVFKKNKKFRIYFKKMSSGKNEFKTIFLECQKSKELLNLNKLSQIVFKTKKPFKPHMSIVYGNFKKEDKKNITDRIEKFGINYFSFEVKHISLWKAFGTANKWKRLKKVNLQSN